MLKCLAVVLCGVLCAFGALAAPAPPTLGPIGDHAVFEDQATEAIRLDLSDPDTPNLSLKMTGSSDNPSLVPVENIFFGVFQTWYVTVTPAFGQTGSANITVTASDETSSVSRSFVLTVNPSPAGWGRFFNSAPMTIPAAGIAAPYPTGLEVTGRRGVITDMKLVLSRFSHDRVRDVNALLVGPTGQGLVIMSHSSGNRSCTNVSVYLTDHSAYALPSDFELWSEPLRPAAFPPDVSFPGLPEGVVYGSGLFSVFRGQPANGTWSLYVFDDAAGAAGAILGGWSLFIATDQGGSSPPSITDIPDRHVTVGVPTGPIPFAVHDPDSPSAGLTLSASSSNPTLVPPANVVLGGSGANRSVTVTPAAGRTGTATITVSVSDGALSTNDSFVVAVGIPNARPTITAIPAQVIDEDISSAPISFTVGDAETPAEDLKLSSSSSTPTLIPTNNIVFGGSGAERTVTVTAAANQSGTATITVIVSDGLASAGTNFLVTVNPVNDPPVISAISNQTTTAATAVGPLSFTVSDLETPVGSLTLSASSSNPTLVPTDHIAFGGAAGNRTVTVTPMPGETGSTTITIAVNDGTLSASNSFVLAVNPSSPGTEVFSNPAPISIPSVGVANPYPSTINVEGVPGRILHVMVTIKNITHTWLSDVDMLLVGPDGQKAMILSDVGVGQSVNNLTLTLSDTAPASLRETGQILSGIYRPTNVDPGEPSDMGDPFAAPAPGGPYPAPLSAFIGHPANGLWSLYVLDDGNGDGGSIASGWTLSLTIGFPPTLSEVPEQTTTANVPTAPIPFTVQDEDTALSNLSLTASSSDPLLVPNDGLVFNGSGSNRNITITPAPDKTGSATVTVMASDGILTGSCSFVLNVRPVVVMLPTLVPLGLDPVRVGGTGDPGVAYTIEASTDLLQWLTIGAATSDANGRFEFEDPNAPTFPIRFYRAVWP